MALPQHLAINELMNITTRLGRLWMWSAIWLAHLTAAVAAGFVLWWWRVTPAQCTDAFLRMQASKPFATYAFLGGSILGLLALYVKLLRLAHGQSGKQWLSRYLMKVS